MQMKADQLRAEIASIGNLLKSGRPDRAFKRATKAAKKWPKVAALPRLAGISAVQQQKPKLAQTYFEQAWRLEPGNAELIQNYALSLVQGGDPADALTFLSKIVARGPLTPAMQFIRALALLQVHETDQALDTINKVLTREPANPNAQLLKADILDVMQRWQEAAAVLTALVGSQPKFVPGLIRLAKSQLGLGQFDSVLQNAAAALALAPGNAETLELMAGLPNLTEEEVSRLQAQISDVIERGAATSPEDKVKLLFAAAEIARRQNSVAQEMQYLAKAHKLQRGGFTAWEDRSEKECASRLAAPLPDAAPEQPAGSARPIFVVGLPRSGTTLVERILGRHPTVQGLGELASVHQWARQAEAQLPEWRVENRLSEFYLDKLPDLSPDALAFVDKAPGNYAFLDQIAQAFPNAVIINVQRDPRDVALSMWRANFGAAGLYFTHDFQWMAAEANRYQRYLRRWHSVLPDRIHDIRYETLVGNLDDTVQELCRICDLSFENAMLSPDKSSNAIKTASNLQARKPVNTLSVGGWHVAAEQLDPFIRALDAELWPEAVEGQA
ncbi:hypothetical protein RA27_22930 [Ruegeria sp. ANG-R]|uniref:tetratricopeptide repeat-containing sulfotransferase family protein n=1 Tax=Ruegeria sp. ANG-R TaxID=1577903 RepID=UPI00058271C5|nr:tetratricopeptide repeat-containing sulfotransferase family protein [Ruegeria sp. ANG-R]KIC35390.1 hypothetical protein RA27_22930 [Ruegeria sp. ANG-R]